MSSPNFFSSFTIQPGGIYDFGGNWDPVLHYNNFFVELMSDQNITFTSYQNSNPILSLVGSVRQNFYLNASTSPEIFSGSLTNSNITFTVQNLNNNASAVVRFYVVYK